MITKACRPAAIRRVDVWSFLASLVLLVVQGFTDNDWLLIPWALLLAGWLLIPGSWTIHIAAERKENP